MKNINKIKASSLVALGLLCLAGCGILGTKKASKSIAGRSQLVKLNDTTNVVISKGPKKFSALITAKAIADSGLFNIYKQDEKYFLEIADSLLGREVLVVSRIIKAAADNRNPQSMLGYGGDEINENVIRFEKGPSGKIFMRSISFEETAGDSTSVMYRSVMNSNIQPIAASFEVKGLSKNEKGSIIELTDYLNGDNDILFFDPSIKTALKLGGYQVDKSYIVGLNAYASNIEIKTVKTYSKTPSGSLTYELNSSMVLLPAKLMQSRSADERVGYFTSGYTDFNSNPQGIEKVNLITRWRLEPKEKDKQKYLAGELVEPAKQIVFYIDPATPKKWVPYLILGVNDWNIAFEKAGFKNAIVAKEAPLNDKEWSLEDASHNAIIYKPSEIPNASGPHVHDPRTGEILETHVNWYHNVMHLVRNWYLVQAGATDPRARKMIFDDELMGQLIRFVSSHEIGHTLGLLHNFGSSSTVPVEKLRDKIWVEKYGHTPSIMDYARFNYVAQPEDGISEKGIFPRINDYDLWAIEWGYRWFPEESKDAEKARMNKWIIDRTTDNKRLWFGSEPLSILGITVREDPRSQSEDLGDNPMKASSYGIKNLKRILPNIINWSKSPNGDFTDATELYKEILSQYSRYVGHVIMNIGGVMNTPKSVEEKGPVVEYVGRTRQKEAVDFLNEHVFTTPSWLLNKEIFNKTGNGSIATISRQQEVVLQRLISTNTLYKLLQFEGNDPLHAYTVSEMLNDLKAGIFSELKSGKAITIYRRNLQKSYIESLMKLFVPPILPPGFAADTKTSDIPFLVKIQLREINARLKTSMEKMPDKMSKAHLQDLSDRINGFFKNEK